MITIPQNQRITRVVWYAANLTLSGSYPWKPYVDLLRLPSAAGTGYSTFSPASGFNAVTTLETGKVYDFVLKNLPAGGIQIDNGTAPTGTVTTSTMPLKFKRAGVEKTEVDIDTLNAGTYTVTSIDPAITTPKYSQNGSLPAALTQGQSLTFANSQSFEVEATVATAGALILLTRTT